MCAAPGGKTLVLASTLGQGGEIVANERSSQRRKRLKTVLDAHLAPALRSCVAVTGHNAAVWGLHEKNAYDRVLLDAPCSSERHLVLQPRYLAAWSPSRSRSLARQAYAMLLAALDAAKPGGLLLYSTCALLEAENDEVIRRALERRPGAFTPIAPLCAEKAATLSLSLEKTRFGSLILPDTSDGAGPLYFALLRVG
jgi:16S rRNA C967 or C1407 C5-methylase (RsmB/RsmF family)